MSVQVKKSRANKVLDKLFGWLDGPTPAAPPAQAVKATPRQGPVPANATPAQKEAARLAAMSPAARESDIGRTNRAYAHAAKPGAIQAIVEKPGWFHVISGDGTHYYAVSANGQGFCDCPDQKGYARAHGGCFHLRAVRMYVSGIKQVAAEIIKEKRTPMPDGKSTNEAIDKFLGSCCEVRFYNSGTLWRGTWLNGYELNQGGGTFEKLGFTKRQLMDYAVAHEPEILLKVPRNHRKQITVAVRANKQEHRDRRVLREAQVLEEKGQPRRSEIIEEQNAEMVIDEALREDFENAGQQVAAAVRAVAETPSGIGHSEQAEPPVDPEDDPGPLAAPAAPKGKTIVSACVTATGTLVVVQGQGPEFKPMLPGKTFADVFTALRKAGLEMVGNVGYENDASAFLVNPAFVEA